MQIPAQKEQLYYMQNGFLGDTMYFWRKNNAGYTSNIDEARLWTAAAAKRQHECRVQDVPWPAEYIQARAKRCVNVQAVSLKDVELP